MTRPRLDQDVIEKIRDPALSFFRDLHTADEPVDTLELYKRHFPDTERPLEGLRVLGAFYFDIIGVPQPERVAQLQKVDKKIQEILFDKSA